MTMFVNLHTLPVGQSMFTALVSCGDEYADEIDFVASSRASLDDLIVTAATCDDSFGYEGCSIVAIANQSDGYVVWQ